MYFSAKCHRHGDRYSMSWSHKRSRNAVIEFQQLVVVLCPHKSHTHTHAHTWSHHHHQIRSLISAYINAVAHHGVLKRREHKDRQQLGLLRRHTVRDQSWLHFRFKSWCARARRKAEAYTSAWGHWKRWPLCFYETFTRMDRRVVYENQQWEDKHAHTRIW